LNNDFSSFRFMPRKFERSQTRLIGVPEWRVLLILAYDGPQTMYQISKEHKVTYPLVHRATLSLERLNWIGVIETKVSEKNVSKKIYGLTSEGLLWLLSRVPKTIPPTLMDKSLPDPSGLRKAAAKSISEPKNLETQTDVHIHLLYELNINRIAEANTGLLPLVFEFWKSYAIIGIVSDLTWRFPETAFGALVEYYKNWECLKDRFSAVEEIFAYKLYYAYLEHLGNASDRAEAGYIETPMQQIAKVFSQSPELRELLDQILAELNAKYKKNLAYLKRIKTKLNVQRTRAR
jgi:hypothetical protein